MPMPVPGNLIDIPIEEIEGNSIVARFRVLQHEPERDIYLMQVIDVYKEHKKDEARKES